MNVLFATNVLDMGGIETNLLLLSRELTARGHSVTIVSSGGALVERCAGAGARHVAIPIGLSSALGAWRSILAFRAEVVRGCYDVIHVFSASSAAVAKGAALVAGTGRWPPVVSSVMGLANSPKESMLVTQLRNFACTLGATRILVMSPAIGAHLRRLPIRRARMVDRLAVGVDLALQGEVDERIKEELRRELRLEGGRPLISTIGQLSPRKSHHLFVAAAIEVLRDVPDAVFAIVGEGPDRKMLDAQIAQGGAEASVRLLGERGDIANVLSLTTVYVKPGIVEGFVGITVLEAQAMGCPVVAFETEDVKLAIEDGVTGLIARGAEPGQLASCVLKLLRSAIFAAEIAHAGREKVRAEFSIQAVVTGLLAEYRAVIGERAVQTRRGS